MVLTRDFKEGVWKRAKDDPEFQMHLICEVIKEALGNVQIMSISTNRRSDSDDDVLSVTVVFDDDTGTPDPRATSSLLRFLRPQLMEAGEDAFPVVSFIAKSELG